PPRRPDRLSKNAHASRAPNIGSRAKASLGLKVPLGLVLAVHFAPVPYNVFLTLAVWRTAEKAGGARASLFMLGSALWLIATIVV
ncbi:hypothetical protein FJ941_22075, partial [Mesorhizobium sp. B2-3-13]|uniref:hypothetical protein n=1 Tax=Mesorhizobium sp. B2-3-13 TaxID=2589951 RepID=UPI001126F696